MEKYKSPSPYEPVPNNDRHQKFQFGTNPLEMSAFEKSLAHAEKKERFDATVKYTHGIQGIDGGVFDDREYDPSKFAGPSR